MIHAIMLILAFLWEMKKLATIVKWVCGVSLRTTAINTIKNQSCKEALVINLLLTIHEFIEATNKTVNLQWIPSH